MFEDGCFAIAICIRLFLDTNLLVKSARNLTDFKKRGKEMHPMYGFVSAQVKYHEGGGANMIFE